ncbi:MAG: hypothetical protein KAG66_08470 [Methylococcales bacterium]|nr:hypothetical protein [Methylococcales bacterium]
MPLTVNLNKAKDITRERLRADRAPLLATLDIEFQRALESGADTSDIVKRKQELRDVTDQVSSATSLAELKAMEV